MIDGRDLWFPNYVWTGQLDVDNQALKAYSEIGRASCRERV